MAYNKANIDEVKFTKIRVSTYVKGVREINTDIIVEDVLKAIEEHRRIN